MKDITSLNIIRFVETISASERPVIVTHAKPDGDAIGSTTAMLHFLTQKYGKGNAKLILNDDCPRYLGFIKSLIPSDLLIIRDGNIGKANEAISDSDLIICLDFNAFHRTDTLCGILEEASAEKILIDHHLSPEREKFSLIFSVQDISSASELLYHILLQLPAIGGKAENLPHKTATALMTGMTTDTNNFANSVYPSTFEMASRLIEAGVDRDMILSKLYNRSKESRLRLQGHVLKDLMKITEDGVAYIVLDKDTMLKYNVEEGDTEGFVNIPLSIDKVLMSILVKEDKGHARVSIRSKKGISANTCSRLYFNGGGHENAAGGRLYMPENISDISQAGKYIEENTHIFMNRL